MTSDCEDGILDYAGVYGEEDGGHEKAVHYSVSGERANSA